MAQTPSERRLEIRDFAGAGDPTALLGAATRQNAPHLDALRDGRLVLQGCAACGRLRHPVAPVCPYCGGRELEWRRCGGEGVVHSWARVRRGFLAEFEPLLPYDVLCVELAEGPRIFGRFADADVEPWIGMPVRAIAERFPGGACVVAFVAPAPAEAPNRPTSM